MLQVFMSKITILIPRVQYGQYCTHQIADILYISNTQPAIACSKLTIETLEQGVRYVRS